MGQTVDNGMNNINKMIDAYAYTKGTQENSHTGARVSSDMSSNSYDAIFKYDKTKNDNSWKSTAMDNFEEYMKNQQEKAKETGQDEAGKEREAKEAAKEISRNLSAEEMKQLEMMGVDIDTANLSDIMGMVNTMRGNAHRQETKELMAKLTLGDGDTKNLAITGGDIKTVDGTTIEGISVSDVIVAEDKNQKDSFFVSDNEFLYITKNNLPLDKSNLYKAHFSGVKAENNLPDDIISKMMEQMEKVIGQAGYEVDETSISGAKLLINNDLPVTTDNIRKYMDFQQYVGRAPEEIDLAEEVVLNTDKLVKDRAEKLYHEVKNISPVDVFDMVSEGRQPTIAATVKYVGETRASKSYDRHIAEVESQNSKDLKAITAMRQMEEIRLSMTTDVAAKLVKMDINIDTRELSKVVAMLKDMENKLIGDTLHQAGVPATKENINIYQETSVKVREISESSARILAAPLVEGEFTINNIHSSISTKVSENTFESVRRSYEAVGTAPRRDMGDSISKAFSNVDDILTEMSLPVNYENQRAVRILGYNSLSITEENINQVIWYDRQVNDMINGFYPEAVLGMIKDGINPMDVPIDELNRIIQSKNYNEGVTEAKNFATFLRDMDNQGEITARERESYIGMYRVLEGLAKSGDREAGWIFANGSRLTVRNIVAAMRSSKSKGFNVEINEEFGMLQDMTVKGNRIDEQISSAFDSIKNVTPQVEEYMEENAIEYNAINIKAVTTMLHTEGGIYSLVSELLGKMKFTSNSKSKLVDEETENISDSLSGEDIPVDFTPENILEHLRGSEEMSLTYEDLRNQLTELMYQAGATGDLNQMDIASIKVVNAGFNILKNMARQEKYQVPIETKQGTKVMNLTIKRDSDNRGLIQISVSSESYGNISAEIKAFADNVLGGYVVSHSSEGNYALKEREEDIKNTLVENGYNIDSLQIGSVSDISTVSGISSERLYEVSVAVVKSISVVMG